MAHSRSNSHSDISPQPSQGLEAEVTHFQSRLHRIEDGHRLELARLKKEVEYHKRLRQVGRRGGWVSRQGSNPAAAKAGLVSTPQLWAALRR